MKRAFWLVAVAIALLFIAPPLSAGNPKTFPPDHPFIRLLTGSGLERGREHRALLIVPVVREDSDPPQGKRPMTAKEAQTGQHLSVGEPEGKEGRFLLEIYNWSTERILLLAGEAFSGGYRDRFLARDVLLRPGSRAVVPVQPADAKKRVRKDRKKSLVPVEVLAPAFPRYITVFAGLSAPISAYLENAFSVTGDQAPRKPFTVLLGSAKLTTRIDDYRNMFSKIPDEAAGRTVGMAAWVGDRLVGIELFSTNRDLRAHWPKMLRSLAFQAALYEAANGLMKHPFPAGRDPDRHRVELKALLKKPFAARIYQRSAVDLGTEAVMERDALKGRVLVHEGALVHALLMPNQKNALEAPAAPRTGPPPETTYDELIRKAGRSRLTEYEKRLLERMQKRRQQPGGGTTPPKVPEIPVIPPKPKTDPND